MYVSLGKQKMKTTWTWSNVRKIGYTINLVSQISRSPVWSLNYMRIINSLWTIWNLSS